MSKHYLSLLALATLLCMMLFGASSCKKGDDNDNTDYEIIEYNGDYPAPESVEFEENGVTYGIDAIPGQIVISADVDHNTVINAVSANNGKIIEQYPQFGLYTIEVAVGNENTFLTAMDDLNISAELNLVEYPKERYDYFVFDDYADANGVHHGRNVSNILKECQNDAVINEVNNVVKLIIPLNYTNFLLWNKLLSQDMILVNWSHGYGGQSADWQNMTPTEKNSYLTGWKKAVIRKLDQIIRLQKKNPNIDIVFAHAAGNERCPEIAQIISDIKSNPKYKKVLEENMIFVSDHSMYANTSTTYGDFCYINEHPYYNQNGGTTSYATPQALCFINQVIKGTIGEDGKNITAVQALAAVKAAIRQNSNGELDLDEALEMARVMYSSGSESGYFTGTPFDNTSWNVSVTEETTGTNTYRHGVLHTGSSWYYTYYDETSTVNTTSSYVLSPSFKANTLWLYTDGDGYGYGYEFKGDSILIKLIYDGQEHYYRRVRNNVAYYTDNGTETYSRYFVDDDTFCIKVVHNWTHTDNSYDWAIYNYETVDIQEFKIYNNDQCAFNKNGTDHMVSTYGSEYTGFIQWDYTFTGHGTGTYEYGVKNNNVTQGDNSSDFLFGHRFPMKRYNH